MFIFWKAAKVPLYTGKPMISVDATDDVAHPLSRSASAPGQPPPPTQPRPHPAVGSFVSPGQAKSRWATLRLAGACLWRAVGRRSPSPHPTRPPERGVPPPSPCGVPCLPPRAESDEDCTAFFFGAGRVLHLGRPPDPRWGKCPQTPFRGAERHKAAVGCPSHYPAPRDMHKKAPVNLTGALNQTFPSTTSPPPSTRRPSSSYPTQPAPGRSPPSPARAHTDDSDKTPHAAAARPAAPHAQPDSHSGRTSFRQPHYEKYSTPVP